MSDARNEYPRLCWGCLGIIMDIEYDVSLENYGGYCTICHKYHNGEMSGLRALLRGRNDVMNGVSERDKIRQEYQAMMEK